MRSLLGYNVGQNQFLPFLLLNLVLGFSSGFPSSPSDSAISALSVTSHITLRYAQTEVESLVKNPSESPREVKFSMFLPDSAFISFFSMTIDGDEQVAQVMGKKDAVAKFNNAKQLGIGAGLVSENERDSSKFSISTNIESGQKVVFKLKYEELLQRRNGQYEHAININPEGIIENLKVEVFINESLPISSLSVPELKLTNELDFARKTENKDAILERKEGSSEAHILYAPDKKAQRAAGESGVSGQFLVRYDVDRKGKDNEVQVIDGYFVHFFAPDELKKMAKHAVFVLDISGSMMGEKIVQLKDAMFTILDDMTEEDFFSIIVFSSGVQTWSSYELENMDKVKSTGPTVIQASEHNKNVAINYVNNLNEGGATNINDAMLEAINLAEVATTEELLPQNTKSMVIFLTDGMPTVGERNSINIRRNVKDRNTHKIPIFGLAFGRGSDFSLMKEISSEADSFAKRIYEGSDAAIQLEDFFSQISSPLISELKFEYLGEAVDKSSLSKVSMSSFFKGGEYVVVGKLNEKWDSEEDKITIILLGNQHDGKYEKRLDICNRPRTLPVNQLDSIPLPALPSNPLDHQDHFISNCLPQPNYPERSAEQKFMQKLHAFVNIKQLLKRDETELTGGESPRSKALRLALANNFVTELTSLVVVADQYVRIASLESKRSSTQFSSSQVAYSIPSHSLGSSRRKSSRISAQSARPYGGISAQSARSYGGIPAQSALPSDSFYMKGRTRSRSRGGNRGTSSSRVESSVVEHSLGGSSSLQKSDSVNFNVCSGSINLFSKTYHRGINVTISEDTPDLRTLQFADKLVSVSVTGECCWEVFTGTNYSGNTKQFTSSGSFVSTTSVGPVFRNAESVKKC